MSNNQMVSVPPYIGLEPLVGRYYPAQCRRCGWVGSSEELTEDDAQCTRDVGDRLCLGDCDELERHDLLSIIQAMAEQRQGEPVAYILKPPGCAAALAHAVDLTYRSEHAVPLYTQAGHAEVERLRDQLAAWQALAAERLEVTTGLRTQLAEAHSLLHEVGASGFMVDGQIMPSNEALELQDRVDSALCASAEPRPVIAWSVIETPPSESPAIQTTISLQR